MKNIKLIAPELKNIPFQARPEGCDAPVWRHSSNPIIGRNPHKNVCRIFNSAVLPYKGEFIGVFRAEGEDTMPVLYVGYSKDALNWRFDEKPISFVDEKGKEYNSTYTYDPRLVEVDNVYYVIWCTDFNGPAIGLARTTDFKTFTRMENATLPYNRNGVLFPRKVDGKYIMLSRPSDTSHTPFGDIFLSKSPDLIHWGGHRHVMAKGTQWWQSLKIGAGPAPIETSEGWLLIYHGVIANCNGFVYSMGAAILDIDNPSVVKYRCNKFILTPEMPYEEVGFVPNVVFPCAALCDGLSGRIAVYYGCADSYVGVAYTDVNTLVNYIIDNNKLMPKDGEEGR